MRVNKKYCQDYIALLSLFVSLLVSIVGNSQTNTAAKWFQKLKVAQQDTDRVNIYYALSTYYWNRNSDSSLLMAQKSLNLAEQIHFEKGVALAYLAKGVSLVSVGKFPEALECHFKSLALSEKLGLQGLSGNAYNNIGIVYTRMENIPKSIYYFRKALDIARIYDDGTGYTTAGLLVNIGDLYKKNKQYDSALAYTLPALAIERKANDSLGIAIALYNIGENYIWKKMYATAHPYLQQAIQISTRINDLEGLAYCNNAFGKIYLHSGQHDSSIYYAGKGLEQSLVLNITEIRRLSYNLLYENYLQLNNYKKALNYRNLEIALTDSLNSVEKDKSIKNIVADYQLDKKQNQINLLQKDKQIKEKEIRAAAFKRNMLGVGIALLGLIIFFLFRSARQKKKLNLQLEKQNHDILDQNRQLEDLNNVKNKLFSIVSHDLRGPIGSVTSLVELMQEDLISADEQKMLLPKLSTSLLETSQLLDNLLYWAKSQMNGMQLNPQMFPISPVIDQNVSLVRVRATGKNVTVAIENSSSLQVYADQPTTDIVLRNLLENAIKFSKAGDLITVQAKKVDAFAEISIKDNGKGIAYEDQYKIFNKLESHTTFGTAREKGSGLGLLLCKELVEKNHGKIWFTSKPGEGSTFSFSIPLEEPLIS